MLFFIFLPCLYIFYRFFIARILSVLPENIRDWGGCRPPPPPARTPMIPGQPDALYYLPEFQGGAVNLALPVPEREISYAQYDHLVENAVEDEYQQYFQYVIETNHVRKPVHWREALQLYHWLLQIAR